MLVPAQIEAICRKPERDWSYEERGKMVRYLHSHHSAGAITLIRKKYPTLEPQADDILHEVYADILIKGFTDKKGQVFPFHFYKVCFMKKVDWKALKYLRKRQPSESLEDVAEDITSSEPSPFDNVVARELQGCLERLPEETQKILVLKYVEGLSYEEIALELDKKAGTVRQAARRGLRQLRACLGGKSEKG